MAKETVYPAATSSPASGVLASSFQYAVDGADNLRATLRATNGSFLTAVLTGRFRRQADDTIQVFQQPMSTPFGSTLSRDFALEAGALMNLRLVSDSISVPLGGLYGRVQLIRGTAGGSGAIVIATLLQGYFNAENELGWPGSPLQNMHDGRGLLIDAAWGAFVAPLRLSVSSGLPQRWRLSSGVGLFVSSAAAGVRTVFARAFNRAGRLMWQGTGGLAHGPGVTMGYHIGAGMPPTAVMGAGIAHLPWPSDLELEGGSVVELVVDNEQVGDLLTPFALMMRQWIDD